ncbi:hypothetical protein QQ045_019356 [Rhodiola kirilowii]
MVFLVFFYQKFWDKIKTDIIRYVKQLWEEGFLNSEINKTLIVLVPKKVGADKTEEMRPISLCSVSVAVKIITKILATRLQPILNQVISVYQSAFIKGRIITDNFIVAHEISHFLKNCKGKNNCYASLKMDMSKAYDRVEWEFLERIMRMMGFAEKWIDRIMACVTSVTYFVRVNGHISEAIRPRRGLRQGDHLSPYLFLLCSEFLSAKLLNELLYGGLKGIKINRGAPVMTHLFFADDSMFYIKASPIKANNLKRILAKYEEISGQKINANKSEISFSSNTPAVVRNAIVECCGIHQVSTHSKYLGLHC